MKTLENDHLTVKVKPEGAELTSIRNNKTGVEYLWHADPTFWKRHSPVLFPIVGSLWNNELRNDGNTFNMSQHGFARDEYFELLSATSTEVFYQLVSHRETLAKYPFPFQLEIGYRLEDNRIEVIWKVKNIGDSTMYFQIGAHPAFNYPDFDGSTDERGYFSFDKSEGLEYSLLGEKGCALPAKYNLDTQDGLLPINVHTFDIDTLIFEDSQLTRVSLLDNSKDPYITLHFDAPVLGLWSPPRKNAPFICIEPWYGRCDRVGYSGEFKDKDWMNSLAAGEVFKSSYIIEIEV
ncbi:aldose 1-epimerase family protein [Dysgonomonas sp. ZJ709]|uniref:aldose 1-epimerase family protein n=1 Tax=Dysgonomonas sp. ZJ709 TaxID=2709797 RepID=UPI0013EA1191|nr:aldose 1-epimerase family protein [Dysgonomonas sp. ZJ709]